jgi:uncharacterized protein (DUF849 family)
MRLNLTTGAGARFILGKADPKVPGPATTLATWERRVEHVLALKPEICSLGIGNMNLLSRVFVNTSPSLQLRAKTILSFGAKPKLEVFKLGHIRLARHLLDQKLIAEPPLFQICLGIPWGHLAPETMMVMRDQLPQNAVWASFGIAPSQFSMIAQSVLLGGHVRVGFKDNLYLRHGVPARSNAELIQESVKIVQMLDNHAASPSEARSLFHIR